MTAAVATVLATSGGLRRGERTFFALAPLFLYGLELAGVSGRAPRVCAIGTALGDDRWRNAQLAEATAAAGVELYTCNLFPMPPSADLVAYLGDADMIWVGGGSVANLLALWRLHGLDVALRTCWESGIVCAGVSAGSICWHVGGTTDSFGPKLQPVTDALGFLPYANGVHYDSEPGRRPLLQGLVADGTLPDAYATDDGVGLVYRNEALEEVVTERAGAAAWRVARAGDGVTEERLAARPLPGAAAV